MATQVADRGNDESHENHDPSPIAASALSSRRQLSRSPHPYHRHGPGLLTPTGNGERGNHYTSSWRKSSRTSSESGTEADDESTGFLKGLPAPRARPRHNLSAGRGSGQETGAESTAERLWYAFRRSRSAASRRDSGEAADGDEEDALAQVARRNRIEVLRRLFETVLVLAVAATVYFGNDVRFAARAWNRELLTFSITILVLYLIYPFQISTHGFRRRSWKAIAAFPFSTNLDPAPLIYPVLLPVLIALSLVHNHQTSILPNIILGLSSIPSPVIPFYNVRHDFIIAHWAITILPVIISDIPSRSSEAFQGLNPELQLLIFPLHQALVTTLHFLSTTSLLPTELQLLATGLINILLFASSPQGEILKALLWLGGICMLALCQHVLRWEVTLARIPSWKFRRSPSRDNKSRSLLKMLDHSICYRLSHGGHDGEVLPESDVPVSGLTLTKGTRSQSNYGFKQANVAKMSDDRTAAPPIHPVPLDNVRSKNGSSLQETTNTQQKSTHSYRRQSSTIDDGDGDDSVKITPSGRRKRLVTPNVKSFLSLTAAQARVRKWAYALYTYAATLFIILLPVRRYVGRNALHGNEPFGWAIGYLFGNIPSFRFQIVKANLENWVRIPPLLDPELDHKSCRLGWVEHLRRDTLGEANTRLLISCYCALVIVVGLALVIRLNGPVEVDTRRKVFHGMMVLMFLPATFIDPTFTALALALVLAVFLLLDLFRASQLPPISKPLTYFLAPYVDGRDHRGPVIVSHIFLLIGCAVPLWLSLAGIPRTGSPPWEGWDVETRDLSMVSGVICVGMGDAAASVVGRRYGRHKWFWGGGKSIEGSMAFALAVFVGILAARVWLIVGGWDRSVSVPMSQLISASWPTMATSRGWVVIVAKSILAALGSSCMEAVLTGGNDNVVVPLVLWLLVRGLGL
ncbi:phosphatidate cytidylyltransferase [Blastomyces dermatitidis ATCC 18188]|uniref:dolichol kinase n=1 Tax=Ajellomyces dermatitidis (strain ATCC 18188 / CBS 674.68) TaxID=653446 RepID=F2TRF9_AJEDA|nr:phosphatidate cytidylyltransferase [Blastomyces dermatitidis ATCC 18188]